MADAEPKTEQVAGSESKTEKATATDTAKEGAPVSYPRREPDNLTTSSQLQAEA